MKEKQKIFFSILESNFRDMKSLWCSVLYLMISTGVVMGQLKSPDEFLGYELGTRFTAHADVTGYFRHIAENAKNVKLVNYGTTYEGRELIVAIITAADNLDRLEQIRQNNLKLSLAEGPEMKLTNQPAILWLSYNVHGNEASSTETAMKMLYTLAAEKATGVQQWLKNTVVILDPCLNPDGRERYVNYFRSVMGALPNPDPMAREHMEPWPGGRSNHYYFDLNRDWAWQTQVETQQRLELYHEWMPEVHVDFHEQSYNDPYYFAPAAEPVHQDITDWQRSFQVTVGKNNAKYFDEQGWQYFTKEQFDLLYPSYGDTYPLYNGAIGMTYEQGGIGAGLSVVTLSGDTLTLKDRIAHHFTSGMATLEAVSDHAGKLVDEFRLYFERSAATAPGTYKSVVIKAQHTGRMKKLRELLDKNHIKYAFGMDRGLSGYNYETHKTESFKVERNDMVIPLQQPRSVLANVLLEPQTSVSDSNTYDITAWALPYVYGLKAYALTDAIKGKYNDIPQEPATVPIVAKPYAWIFPWDDIEDAQVLIALQRAQIKVRIAGEAFTSGGRSFPAGTLLVYRLENEKQLKSLSNILQGIEQRLKISFFPATSGFVEKGKDFGSSVYQLLKMPKVAMVMSEGSSTQSSGEIWHFMEQVLEYPVSIISNYNMGNLDINKVNVLIVPDGSYGSDMAGKLESWLNLGGKVILFEDAIANVNESKPFAVKKKELAKSEEKVGAQIYSSRNQDNLAEAIPGAIFKVYMDRTHPLAAGIGDYYYALKTDDRIFEPLIKGWNVGVLKSDSYISGIAGKQVIRKLDSGMLIGVQNIGRGTAVYLGTDVLFRSFWESGKQLFVNALFLVN